jgi:hypothetical protein
MTVNKPTCPLLKVNALNDVFWNEMRVYDKYKNVFYPIKNKTRYLTKVHKCDYIIALDSETYKGKCKLLCDSNDRYILNPTFLECLDFLYYKAYVPNGYRFFYNIDFDITAILKLWNNINKIKDLKEGLQVSYHDYKMVWFKGKFFKLTKNNKYSVNFTDLWNFFKIGLGKASKQYLKDIEKDKIDGNKLNTSIQYWNNNLYDIIVYCLKDCIITKSLARTLISALEKAEISLPKMLVSSGSLAKQDFRINCRMNNLRNVPKNIIQIAYDCYYGGKFEVQKRGFFKQLYLYDINSQYPDFIKELYDLSYGIWQKIFHLPIKESFGYFKVDLDIPDNIELSTIPLKLKNSIILTVCGIIKNRWYTWFDLDLMRDYITKFHLGYIFKPVLKESEITPDKLKYVKPFKERIMYHYGKKSEYKNKNEMLYNCHKITMNAVYGSFIERHSKLDKDGNIKYSVGILFNPIYASQICAFGRWSVIQEIPKNKWKYIVGIHTDSIMTEINLDKYLTIDNRIGNWNLENSGKALIINTGMYQINDLVKTRGIPNDYIKKVNKKGKLVKDWFSYCKTNKNVSKTQFEQYHMRKISEALIRDKDLINANTMTVIKKSININSDSKRHWKSDFLDFQDLSTRKINSYLWYVDIENYELFKDIDFSYIYQNPNLTM